MAPEYAGDPLERHDRIERGHLDADDAGEVEDRVERGVVVGHTTCRLIQPEGDDGQFSAQARVVRDRIGGGGKCEQRIGMAAAGLDGHGEVARPRYDHAVGQCLAPGLQHRPPLFSGQVRPAAGMRPDGHTRDRLLRHPAGVAPLGRLIGHVPANRHGHRGDQTPGQPASQCLRHRLTRPSRGGARAGSAAPRAPCGAARRRSIAAPPPARPDG